MKPTCRTSWILQGIQLCGSHPESFEDYGVSREYRLPLVLAFVNNEKGDGVETNAILSALVDQEVDSSFVRTLAGCYKNCSVTVQLFHRPLT
ncbi:unnamed protein product [Strongylus vulgaris]|uniref:Uncharacterized protein n=1 Tax=Strongylus vulgaris TaxID=40348 RepID=A0A3P7ISR0_STRVU|nr:unnamed protein product [Strongylus vulgaris]